MRLGKKGMDEKGRGEEEGEIEIGSESHLTRIHGACSHCLR
jgi:hypothetical protein